MSEATGAVPESAMLAAREVRTVFSRVRRRLKESYDPEGLTPSQTSALGRLSKDGDASVSDLAAAERVRHQSMAATVSVLEERGLVRRRPDPGDGRRQLMSVSEDGQAFLEDKRRAGEEWLTRALAERCTEQERLLVIKAMTLLDKVTRP